MAASREVVYLADFSGGLNLTTQLQSLSQNESPDCLNIDFGYRGGFVSRGGFQTQDYDAKLNGAYFLGATFFSADNVLLVAADAAGSLLSWDGNNLTDTAVDVTTNTSRPVRMASFVWERSSVQYQGAFLVNCLATSTLTSRKWNGTALTTYAAFAFNDDYTAPVGGKFPPARLIANHNGYMWVADTVESSKRYPHRVRFSHLQNPEDWAEADYFDVAPEDDGNPITALVPFQDKLLVFKSHGVYAVFGYSRDEFFVERLSDAGTDSPRAVAVSEAACFWYDGSGVLFVFDGRSVRPLSENLRWWADIGKIASQGDTSLMWADGRLYVSLEAGLAESVSRWLFVYDPVINAWTRYDPVSTSMFYWERIDSEHSPLFLFESDSNMYRFDRGYNVDSSSDGVTTTLDTIDGYYRTGWIRADETATKKRWKRPRVTAAGQGATTIRIDVYHDFHEEQMIKFFDLIILGGDDSIWGTMLWGEDWSAGQDDFYTFKRMPSGGSAYALQLKFSATNNVGRWWVDSIAIPFRRKQVR